MITISDACIVTKIFNGKSKTKDLIMFFVSVGMVIQWRDPQFPWPIINNHHYALFFYIKQENFLYVYSL